MCVNLHCLARFTIFDTRAFGGAGNTWRAPHSEIWTLGHQDASTLLFLGPLIFDNWIREPSDGEATGRPDTWTFRDPGYPDSCICGQPVTGAFTDPILRVCG